MDKLRIGSLPPLSFEVRAGECLTVEGRSGSGKSRLLRAIADLDPAPGYVYLGGRSRAEHRPGKWRRYVRFVPAEPGWWAATAAEHAPRQPASRARFERLLSDLEISAELVGRPILQLSTGERRRVALALALADEPKVVLLDEPTSGLDTARTLLVEEVVRFQLLTGRVVLIASYDAAQIERLADSRLQLTPEAASGVFGALHGGGSKGSVDTVAGAAVGFEPDPFRRLQPNTAPPGERSAAARPVSQPARHSTAGSDDGRAWGWSRTLSHRRG